MASKVPEYLIEIFEEAVANNNYDIDDIIEKAKVKKINYTKKQEKVLTVFLLTNQHY